MDDLNLSAPTSWEELTQDQLAYLMKSIAVVSRDNMGHSFRSREDYGKQIGAQVALRCLLHFNSVRVVCPYADGWLLEHEGKEYVVPVGSLAAAAVMLSWMSELPSSPVRLDVIDGAKAVSPDIDDDLSFDDFLACEALWQVWQQSQEDSLFQKMAAILYRKEDIVLREHELLSVFYWWAGLKALLNRRYPDFFKAASTEPGAVTVNEMTLRRSMDSQIRALTKGDVTKEAEVLALPAHRALTELDALAREYDNLNRKYPSK